MTSTTISRAAGGAATAVPVPHTSPDGPSDGFDPIQVVTVELARPLQAITRRSAAQGTTYRRARVLVLLHDVPVGVIWIDVDGPTIPARTIAAAIDDQLAGAVRDHLAADGSALGIDAFTVDERALLHGLGGTCRSVSAVDSDTPLVSVVLATRGRPASLPHALDALLAGDHPNFEVVVVDNSPEDGRTAALVAQRYAGDARIRLVAEPRPGLSYARNQGLSAARGDVVAFTDDDVIVHPAWLRRLAAEFADPAVACATGLVEPVELESLSQWWFECGAGFGRGVARRAYRLDDPADASPLFPYQLGIYGTGASMALRKGAMPEGWMFDEALGAGSPTQGGEDIDLFLDALTSGGVLVYQPAALSFHRHRADDAGLRKQMRGYGRGLTALLVKRLVRRPGERRLLVAKVVAGVRHALSPDFRPSTSTAAPAAAYPVSLKMREVVGMIQGPVAYAVGARRVRRDAVPAA